MKIILLFTIITFSLSSCSLFVADYEQDEKIKELISEIEEEDTDGIRDLFAPNILNQLTEFDTQTDNLIDYYQGSFEEIISRGTDVYKSFSSSKLITFLSFGNWEIKTSETYYYFSIYWCTEDDFDKNNIGIWNLRLQAHEEGEDPSSIVGEEWRNGDSYRGITLIET